jgi:hypothetical protein
LLACAAAKSVHGTVVDGHREEYILENAVLIKIEKLRRVSLASLRAKSGSICSGASPGGYRLWLKEI